MLSVPRIRQSKTVWIQVLLKKIMIYAYADKSGSEKNNHELSVKRAEQVKEYLIKQSIPQNQIPICEGMGEENTGYTGAGKEHYRRTDIFLLRTRKQTAAIKADGSKRAAVLAKSFNAEDINKTEVNQLLRLDNIIFTRDLPKRSQAPKMSSGYCSRQ